MIKKLTFIDAKKQIWGRPWIHEDRTRPGVMANLSYNVWDQAWDQIYSQTQLQALSLMVDHRDVK